MSDCRHALLIKGEWVVLLRAALWMILFLQQLFLRGRATAVSSGGWGVGGTNRKSPTTNCPPLDQLSHKEQACLHKRLPVVFTASTHFCFTTSKLLRRLFCFTWTVSVRATLADESSRGWQASGSSRMDSEGYTGSGRLRVHSLEEHRHGLSTSSLITCGVLASKESGCLRRHLREEGRARHLIGPILISPTNKTGRKCLRGRGMDYTLHAGKEISI